MTFNNTTIANQLYPVANATTSSNPFVVAFQPRPPTVNDIQYPIQKIWLNTILNDFWFLKNFNTANGITTAVWIPMSTAVAIETLTGDTGGPVPPDPSNTIFVLGDGTFITTVGTPLTNTLTIEPAGGLATIYTENTGTAVPVAGNLNVLGTAGITTTGAANTITIASDGTIATTYVEDTGSAVPALGILNVLGTAGITTSGAGNTITITGSGSAFNYTNVTGPVTYVVLTTDHYISCDSTLGAITLQFPNAPTFKQLWIVKDRTGTGSTNNINITTPGGTVTFDGLTTYIMNSNYQAINLLANMSPAYEVY